MRKKKEPSPSVDLNDMPGHCVRRVHQISMALFMQEVNGIQVTPVQYSALHTISRQPGIDQGRLARTIAFDTSTIGSVIDRLEARGLVLRTVGATDKRVRTVTATADGERLLASVVPPMLRSQELFLAPLSAADRQVFMSLLLTLIDAHAAKGIGAARSPSD